MSVRITGVESGSPAERQGVRAGDILVRINGHEVHDVLDYRFYLVDTRLSLLISSGGKEKKLMIQKAEYDDPGLCFETYLMDQKHSCKNGCVFCFIDQLPRGMRESLYFKDDDERLSFLMGNYITLTNLTEREVERIVAMHISPVNISVHTMNPELRVRMMRNKNAGRALAYLRRLAQAGTSLNCQLVLCPGLNDGDELDFSLEELGKLYPSVQSVAAVPVGLTRCREGLSALEPYTRESARDTLRRLLRFGDRFEKEHGVRLAYPADEFFLKAGEKIPDEGFYGEFAQLENGVGMLSLFMGQFDRALAQEGNVRLIRPRRLTIATGTAAFPFIESLCRKAEAAVKGLSCGVYAIENRFFGGGVNVSGLVTGQDLVEQLRGGKLGEAVLIPSNMLRSEGDRFLDDLTLEDVQGTLGVPVVPVDTDGFAFYDALRGEQPADSLAG